MSGARRKSSIGHEVGSMYVYMLKSFKKTELKTLLMSFGRGKVGSKLKLTQLAEHLIFNKESGFCHQAYLVKIVELYNLIQNGCMSSYDPLKSITANFHTEDTFNNTSRTITTRRTAP